MPATSSQTINMHHYIRIRKKNDLEYPMSIQHHLIHEPYPLSYSTDPSAGNLIPVQVYMLIMSTRDSYPRRSDMITSRRTPRGKSSREDFVHSMFDFCVTLRTCVPYVRFRGVSGCRLCGQRKPAKSCIE